MGQAGGQVYCSPASLQNTVGTKVTNYRRQHPDIMRSSKYSITLVYRSFRCSTSFLYFVHGCHSNNQYSLSAFPTLPNQAAPHQNHHQPPTPINSKPHSTQVARNITSSSSSSSTKQNKKLSSNSIASPTSNLTRKNGVRAHSLLNATYAPHAPNQHPRKVLPTRHSRYITIRRLWFRVAQDADDAIHGAV